MGYFVPMERASFIPGREAREEIEDVGGRITIDRDEALRLVDEFIKPEQVGSNIYQLALTVLSAGDRIEVSFGLHDAMAHEEANGELAGSTSAQLVEVRDGEEHRRLLYEVDRSTELISDAWAQLAFWTYRKTLAVHYLVQGRNDEVDLEQVRGGMPGLDALLAQKPTKNTTVSRALSPTTLHAWSGIMFWYVELGTPLAHFTGRTDAGPFVSRPMRALEALKVAALVTLIYGAPPLVFAINQSVDLLGKIVHNYRRVTNAEESAMPQASDAEVVIVV